VKRLLAACFVTLGSGAALAADLPVKAPYSPVARPIYDWTGIYIGANGGGGRSSNCWTQNGANVPILQTAPGSTAFLGLSGFIPGGVAEGCNSGSGAVAGGQIGARYQFNSFVFGIEAQGDWANLSGSNPSQALPHGLFGFPATLTNQTKTDAIGTFTGQVGYSFGPVLWYVKGGAAVTDNKYTGSLNVNFPAGVFSRLPATVAATDGGTAVKFGGVVGTGLEWKFAPNWSIGAEYNHLFMGREQVGLAYTGASGTGVVIVSPAGTPSRNESISQDIDMATVRLNYSFGAR
jgi:outer membrane immunogenic protein